MAGPALLVKLWVAKKLAVLLAVRAFGVKRLYRRGLKLTEYAYGSSYAASRTTPGAIGTEAAPTSRRRIESVMRHTCHAAMITELWFVRRATTFTERAFESAGFSKRGMPGVGLPGSQTGRPPTSTQPSGSSAMESSTKTAKRE